MNILITGGAGNIGDHVVIQLSKNKSTKVTKVEFNVEIASRRIGDPGELVADNSNIKTILGWTPKYNNLEIICKSALNWEKKLIEVI